MNAWSQESDSPVEVIQRTIQRVQEILKNESDSQQAKEEKLREIILGVVDFVEMSKDVVLHRWRGLIPAERDTLVREFRALVEAMFLKRIDFVRGAEFQDFHEWKRGARRSVSVEVRKDLMNALIEIKMHEVNGQWKIYNVSAGFFSLTGMFFSRFDRILSAGSDPGSFEKLIDAIREKTNEMQNRK